MEKRSMVCIICPVGCRLEVEIKDGIVDRIAGNGCKRGIKYAQKECINPTRTLTTTISVESGVKPIVPMKSAGEIPKQLLMKCMEVIKEVKVPAPVGMGQVIIENILGTGINIISSGKVPVCEKNLIKND